LNDRGDFDADTDEVADTAYFRIPCYTSDDEWEIHHLYASGVCDVNDAAAEPYRIGVAHELTIINARGLLLDATLWLPAAAFTGSACPAYASPAYGDLAAWAGCVSPSNMISSRSFPGVVFANGLASRQEHYHWFTERMADEGYVVLNYDPAGQGESEGTFFDTLGMTEAERADPQFAGAVRDNQDAVRWFVGEPITSVIDDGPRLVERADPATNEANPADGVLDAANVSIAGNSMGAISTLAYLDYLGSPGGLGADARPLPMVIAAVSLSGARATHAIVPIQFQTSDGDGSPAFVAPKVGGLNLGYDGQGIGYELIKERYDQLRTTRITSTSRSYRGPTGRSRSPRTMPRTG
jgi:dienelactone hydrolase